uniref:Uncharacterized protein n=1 Tax=Arundo donax TaxID=35708 RepID=A0A0A9FNH9_ARUDO
MARKKTTSTILLVIHTYIHSFLWHCQQADDESDTSPAKSLCYCSVFYIWPWSNLIFHTCVCCHCLVWRLRPQWLS